MPNHSPQTEQTILIPPLDHPTPCIDGENCQICGTIMCLQLKISAAAEVLKDLVDQLQRHREIFNKTHSTFIEKVPVEIMSHIFQLAVPNDAEMESKDCKRRWIYSEYLKLGAVCRSWRNIAWFTQSLWTNVVIHMQSSYEPHRIGPIRDWFLRSGNLPLRISLLASSGRSKVPLWAYTPIFSVITQASSGRRIECLSLTMPHTILGYVSNIMTKIPDPIALHIHSKDGNRLVSSIPLWDESQRPSPRRLSLQLGYLLNGALNIRWNNVTHIVVNTVKAEHCYNILRDAPRLESCIFTDIRQFSFLNVPDETPVVHENLQFLSYQSETYTESEFDLLSAITLPKLDQFHFQVGAMGLSLGFFPFFRRSSFPLTTLKINISKNSMDFTFYSSALETVPTLTDLCLSWNSPLKNEDPVWLISFLQHLHEENTGLENAIASPSGKEAAGMDNLECRPRSTGARRTFLPRLKSLELMATRGCFPWSYVLHILVPPCSIERDGNKRRPLTNLQVLLSDHVNVVPVHQIDKELIIPKGVILRLLDLQGDGVAVRYTGGPTHEDLLRASIKYHDMEWLTTDSEPVFEEDSESNKDNLKL